MVRINLKEKFSKLIVNRNKYLMSGSIELKDDCNDFIENNKEQRLQLVVADIKDVDEYSKVITFKNKFNNLLPIFDAGSYIVLTIYIDNMFVTKKYYLINVYSDNLYKIIVNDSDDVLDKYLFRTAKKGLVVTSSQPVSDFSYNKIRDGKKIVGICSRDGIDVMLSYANSLLDSSCFYSMTLFYNGNKSKDFIFNAFLDEIASKTSKFKVIYDLADNISVTELKTYIDNGTSIFISCNEKILKHLNKELDFLKLPRKYIRYVSFFPKCIDNKNVSYKLTIILNDEKYEIKCYNNRTIMQAITESGFYIPSKCHNGTCNLCRSELLSGKVKVINDKRLEGDKIYNYIHPCCTYPMSDIEIVVR